MKIIICFILVIVILYLFILKKNEYFSGIKKIKGINSFDNYFYINLEHRTDRKESVVKQLSSVDLSGTRFNAVKMNDGRVGCTISHIRCLELAKQNKWDHVLIVEDDILFTQPDKFKYQFKQFLSNETINWDVLLLAGNNRLDSDAGF